MKPLSKLASLPLVTLPRPYIVFQNNHLLVVNKPAGWHSVPNSMSTDVNNTNMSSSSSNTSTSSKCLLTYLQRDQMGGGSQKSFLLPVHRLDQPCTGIQLYAKTSRAASRIQTQWNTSVKKSYLAVLESKAATERLLQEQQSSPSSLQQHSGAGLWRVLQGYQALHRRRLNHGSGRTRNSHSEESSYRSGGGWSVRMVPPAMMDDDLPVCESNDKSSPKESPSNHKQHYRLCSLRYQLVNDRLLLIETNQGARHMIRALLAMAGASLAGDLRYGTSSPPLPDRSVALHARRINLCGNLKHKLGPNIPTTFVAPVPLLWKDLFGITERDILKYELSK